MAVSIKTISPTRIAILSSEGSLLLIDVEGTGEYSVGIWTIMAEINIGQIGTGQGTTLLPLTVPSHPYRGRDPRSLNRGQNDPQNAQNRSHKDPKNGPQRPGFPRDGRIACCGDYVMVVGSDGASRLYDIEAALGIITITADTAINII
jgi:hypothetical protein